VTVISGAGYLFGRHWERLERDIKRFDVVVVVLLALVALFLWWRRRKNRDAGAN